jgi:two-component system OmpR family response regulator
LAVDVLIAEDEPSILESLDFILRRAGWSIASVTDGDAVLAAVRRLRPRLVVLDVMLPKRSGFDVLKQIRADALTPTCRC